MTLDEIIIDMNKKPATQNFETISENNKTAGRKKGIITQAKKGIAALAAVAYWSLAAIGCGGGGSPTGPSPPGGGSCSQVTIPVQGIHNPARSLNGSFSLGNVNGSFNNGVISACINPGNYRLEIFGNGFYRRVVNVDVQQGSNSYDNLDDIMDRDIGLPASQDDYLARFNIMARSNRNRGGSIENGHMRVIAKPTIYLDVSSNVSFTNGFVDSGTDYYLKSVESAVQTYAPMVYGFEMDGIRLVKVCTTPVKSSYPLCDASSMPSDADMRDPYAPVFRITTRNLEGLGGTYDLIIANNVQYDGMTIHNVITGADIYFAYGLTIEGIIQDFLQPLGLVSNNPDWISKDSAFNHFPGPVSKIDLVMGRTSMALLPGSETENDTSKFQTLRPKSVNKTQY
jgi:hypothetical protein